MSKSNWTAFKDKCPDPGELICCYSELTGYCASTHARSEVSKVFSHWMRFPEPPPKLNPFTEWWDTQPKIIGDSGHKKLGGVVVHEWPAMVAFNAGLEVGRGEK